MISATSPLGKLWWLGPWKKLSGSFVSLGRSRETTYFMTVVAGRQHHRAKRLIEGAPDARIVVGEQCAADHGQGRAGRQVLLVFAVPDARIVIDDGMIDAEGAAARACRQRHCRHQQRKHDCKANVHTGVPWRGGYATRAVEAVAVKNGLPFCYKPAMVDPLSRKHSKQRK